MHSDKMARLINFKTSFLSFCPTQKSLKSYALPLASDEEILIEKTPNYMKGNLKTLTNRAQFMKKIIPNLKILVILCDPAKRYISHQKHMLVGYRATALPLDKAEIKLVANVQDGCLRSLKISRIRFQFCNRGTRGT